MQQGDLVRYSEARLSHYWDDVPQLKHRCELIGILLRERSVTWEVFWSDGKQEEVHEDYLERI